MSDDSKIPAPEASLDDKISTNRALALPEPASIPGPTPGYKPSEASERVYLKRIADKQQAEAIQSLDECIEKGPKLTEDLGRYVPSIETLSKLRAQKKLSIIVKAKVEALRRFVEEKDDILNHDIAVALDKITKELAHQIETNNPQLENEYPETLSYSRAHGDSVREGRAKAKQQKDEPR